ncbi:MAG: molybdate ABC transporter substrate-binding protein [Paracoccus sp. (in: a-proteobacteria)]|uniref:molybdate ABC transporter substrate-binding protein n=1 Tax=Paracoccus sp. TaxID=267 RepID=UPI003242230E
MTRLAPKLTLGVVLVLACATPMRAEQITVFAAASLKTALDRVADDWNAMSDDTVVVSYAGSSALAKQIQQGAPADIFISAAVDWMDLLQDQDLILPDSRVDLLGNSLVLIGGQGAKPVTLAPDFDLSGLLGQGKLAMALVASVPAGVYGKQSLLSLGLWQGVAANVAQADNVRAALALVASGEAPLGIVYATDAAAEPDVAVIGRFPDDSHDSITYPAALVADSSHPRARDFLDHLQGDQAGGVFEAEGFTVIGADG